jgi:hypothetical protein
MFNGPTAPVDLRAAKEAIAGPVPLIAEAPDCSFVLPRGLLIRGAYKTDVVVRELNGLDEETLARQRDVIDYFDTVIALGVAQVGDFDLLSLPLAERAAHMRSLLIGERDQLFVAVVKATFGDNKTVGFTCPTCEEKQEADLILSEDFKPREVAADALTGIRTHTTTKGDEIEYRLATGEDQRETLTRKGATTADQNTTLLSRCIVRVNGGILPDPLNYVRKLGIKDRQELLSGLIESQPTINLTLTTRCAVCGAEVPLALSWGDLFRP